MLAKDTICAEMAFMLMERNRPGSTIDYPLGGTSSIVDALRRGIEKNGGKIMLRSHVEEILVEGDVAVMHMLVHLGALSYNHDKHNSPNHTLHDIACDNSTDVQTRVQA